MKNVWLACATLATFTPAVAAASLLPAPGSSAEYAITVQHNGPRAGTIHETITLQRVDASTVVLKSSAQTAPQRIALHDDHLGPIGPPLGQVDHIIDMLSDVQSGAARSEHRIEVGPPHAPRHDTLTINGTLSHSGTATIVADGDVMLPPRGGPGHQGPPPMQGNDQQGSPQGAPPRQDQMRGGQGASQAHIHIVATFHGQTLVRASGEVRDTRANRVLETWTIAAK